MDLCLCVRACVWVVVGFIGVFFCFSPIFFLVFFCFVFQSKISRPPPRERRPPLRRRHPAGSRARAPAGSAINLKKYIYIYITTKIKNQQYKKRNHWSTRKNDRWNRNREATLFETEFRVPSTWFYSIICF